ncbi:hypothetical protein [Blautia wexlerae]|nr:hypothetical protein [Blautia wexlerae]MDB2176280.1 hypothetical protein [Blautia wexlerae]MDB6439628.1 hypothetical protein [Blautia wexlerae]
MRLFGVVNSNTYNFSVYSAYHNLGGNDVATELYHKLLAMPEEQESEE